MNDENTLLNHLILGRCNEAKATIEKILTENTSKNISDTALMQLYVQILNIVFKVMRMKGITYDADNSGDVHIITEIIKQPIPDVHEIIMKYLDIIRSHTGSAATKIDIQAVISYMEENYAEDIGLESIADHFNTAPKYLSKIIRTFKKNTGLTPSEYRKSKKA